MIDYDNIDSKIEVRDDGHWIWLGGINESGKGVVWDKPSQRTHVVIRLIVERHIGRKLGGREHMYPRCHNRKCVNPAHYDIKRHGRGVHIFPKQSW